MAELRKSPFRFRESVADPFGATDANTKLKCMDVANLASGSEARLPGTVQEPVPDVLTPSAVASAIRRSLGGLGSGTVEGEVTATQVSGRGHRYFTLSDGATNIDCFVWEDARPEVDPHLRLGETVRAHFTKVGYVDRSAKVSLNVDRVRAVGEGEILREMERTLQLLETEGLTAQTRRRGLPAYPRVIGVVAGQGSDAMADVVTAIRERFPPARVRTMPAVVEGTGTVDSLIDAMARLLKEPEIDVVVIARGGGSVESLRPFSDERLCRAIAGFPVPVVTSIGHTKQRPNCDHVADASSDVPRAVAELVVPSAVELRAEMRRAGESLTAVSRRVERTIERLALVARGLAGGSERRVSTEIGRVATTGARLDRLRLRLPASNTLDGALAVLRSEARAVQGRVTAAVSQLNRLGSGRRTSAVANLAHARERLHRAARPLHERDGLERGYALIRGDDGTPILTVAALSPGAVVTLVLADGRAQASIVDIQRTEAT